MQEIVHQLGELFLQAVPTVLIVLAFYLILRALFFKPLRAVMAERDARTAGARKAAATAEAMAAEKVKQYQEALKRARAQVYAEQEAARKKVLDERAALLKEARNKAGGGYCRLRHGRADLRERLDDALRRVESCCQRDCGCVFRSYERACRGRRRQHDDGERE